MAKEGGRFVDSFRRIGVSGVIGACGLVGAFIGFIWSITLTTAANTLFLFATMPFLAAFMGIVILKETIRLITWAAMTVALIGITVMGREGLEAGGLLLQNDSVLMPIRNIYLSMVHGTLVGVGLILFSLGAKYFPAAELNLFSLVEVVSGVIWVYLPIFGINEIPSMLTVVGGCIVSGAILLDSVGTRDKSELVTVARK